MAMLRGVFDALMQALAERLAVDAEELVTTRSVVVDDVAVRFQLCAGLCDEDVLMHIHFGGRRGGDDARASENGHLLRLLEVNLYLADAPLSSFFSVDAATGDVVLCIRAPVSSLSVDELEGTLLDAVQQARAWRRGEQWMV